MKHEKMTVGLMIALTFSTGIVDAVGFLGLDKVFTGNMTGNVVILGMALAGAKGLPIAGPAIALLGFMLGAAIGGRGLRGLAPGWHVRTTVMLALVAVTMGVVAVILALGAHPPRPVALTVTGLLGGAMGLQASAARRVGVPDVTTVVVTSTITGLASDSRLGGAVPQARGRRLGSILAITSGALVGALLLQLHIAVGVGTASVLTLVVAVLGHRHHR